jgi:hypothetical protein
VIARRGRRRPCVPRVLFARVGAAGLDRAERAPDAAMQVCPLGVAPADLGLEVRVGEVTPDRAEARGERLPGDPGALAVVAARRLLSRPQLRHVALAQPVDVAAVAALVR